MIQTFIHYVLMIETIDKKTNVLQVVDKNSDQFLIMVDETLDNYIDVVYLDAVKVMFLKAMADAAKNNNNYHYKISYLLGDIWILVHSFELGIK